MRKDCGGTGAEIVRNNRRQAADWQVSMMVLYKYLHVGTMEEVERVSVPREMYKKM